MKLNLIPNVKNIFINNKGKSYVHELWDINKNLNEIIVLEKSIINERSNQYIKKQFKRIEKYHKSGEHKKIDYLIKILITKSTSMLVMALNYKFPKWYYIISTRKLKKLINKVQKKLRKISTDVKLYRVYIPKKVGHPDKYGRPLGVPLLEWRIITYIYTIILQFNYYLINKEKITSNTIINHAGMPGLGCVTLLKRLIKEEILKKKYIYEFDFEGYYTGIIQKEVVSLMKDYQFSETLVNTTKNMISTKPYKIKDETYKINEDLYHKNWHTEIYDYITTLWEDVDSNMLMIYLGLLKDDPKAQKYLEILEAHYDQTDEEYGTKQTVLITKEIEKGLNCKDRGLPQGLSMSPFWASIITERFSKISKNLLMYMDDGIIFADTLQELEEKRSIFEQESKKLGLEISIEKSGMVKSEGNFLKPLKIVGFLFKDENNIGSSTNAGLKKEFKTLNLEKAVKHVEQTGERGLFRLLSSKEDHTRFENYNAYQNLKLAIKLGVIGNLVSKVWSKEEEEDRWLIHEGVLKLKREIRNSRNGSFISKMGMKNEISLLDSSDNKYIHTISTRASELLLKKIKNGWLQPKRLKKI